MRGWRLSCGAVAAGLVVAGCGGGGASQTAGEPTGKFPVQVGRATFPTLQRLAQHTHLVITVRNMGHRTIPDIAVTIINPRYGTAAQAFGTVLPQSPPGQPILAGRSRPVWIVDKPPGPCVYSCKQGGPGGAVTAFSNTWALGKLAPGQVARFDWGVTAVQPGNYTIKYEIAAGLSGQARAVLAGAGHGPVDGTFHVTVSGKPRQAYVNNSGQTVYTK